jgi:multidrug efflux pump subunit AcrB
MEWGGEVESSGDAQASLLGPMMVGILIMYLLLIVLFNAVRHSLVIFLCVPLSLIGVTIGLLATGSSFGFMPLLGMLSLIGMLIKNGIVLVDEIETLRRAGREPLTAILDATTSRVVPVSLAAGTTILGMLPLVLDVFFKDMAIAVMFGLGFATVLTLVVVPVLYAIFFRIRSVNSKVTP